MFTKKELISQIIAAEKNDPTIRITAPCEIFPLIAKYANGKVEKFLCVSLDGEHKILKVRTISTGLLNRVLVHPREVFVGAVKDRAACIILAHNHPSGSLEPSTEDIEITHRLKKAGVIMGIEVIDHMIISRNGFYSFLEEGKL